MKSRNKLAVVFACVLVVIAIGLVVASFFMPTQAKKVLSYLGFDSSAAGVITTIPPSNNCVFMGSSLLNGTSTQMAVQSGQPGDFLLQNYPAGDQTYTWSRSPNSTVPDLLASSNTTTPNLYFAAHNNTSGVVQYMIMNVVLANTDINSTENAYTAVCVAAVLPATTTPPPVNTTPPAAVSNASVTTSGGVDTLVFKDNASNESDFKIEWAPSCTPGPGEGYTAISVPDMQENLTRTAYDQAIAPLPATGATKTVLLRNTQGQPHAYKITAHNQYGNSSDVFVDGSGMNCYVTIKFFRDDPPVSFLNTPQILNDERIVTRGEGFCTANGTPGINFPLSVSSPFHDNAPVSITNAKSISVPVGKTVLLYPEDVFRGTPQTIVGNGNPVTITNSVQDLVTATSDIRFRSMKIDGAPLLSCANSYNTLYKDTPVTSSTPAYILSQNLCSTANLKFDDGTLLSAAKTLRLKVGGKANVWSGSNFGNILLGSQVNSASNPVDYPIRSVSGGVGSVDIKYGNVCAPVAPSDIRPEVTSSAAITLFWKDNSTNETSWVINYRTNPIRTGSDRYQGKIEIPVTENRVNIGTLLVPKYLYTGFNQAKTGIEVNSVNHLIGSTTSLPNKVQLVGNLNYCFTIQAKNAASISSASPEKCVQLHNPPKNVTIIQPGNMSRVTNPFTINFSATYQSTFPIVQAQYFYFDSTGKRFPMNHILTTSGLMTQGNVVAFSSYSVTPGQIWTFQNNKWGITGWTQSPSGTANQYMHKYLIMVRVTDSQGGVSWSQATQPTALY